MQLTTDADVWMGTNVEQTPSATVGYFFEFTNVNTASQKEYMLVRHVVNKN